MNKDRYDTSTDSCPIGRFLGRVEKAFDQKSNFFKHLNQSQIEFLRAVQSLVNGRIETLEEKMKPGEKDSRTKVD